MDRPLLDRLEFTMSSAIFALLLVGLPISAPYHPCAEEDLASRLEELEPFIESIRSDWKTPGVAVGVVHRGRTLFSRGFGFTQEDGELPITPQTLFRIGSISKTLTATAAFVLEDRGVISVDDPISTRVPGFVAWNEPATQFASLADFMAHRAGLAAQPALFDLTTWSRAELFGRLAGLPEAGPFRSSAYYTNLDFVVVGHVLETVTDSAYSELMREFVFEPLEMSSTFVDLVDLGTGCEHPLAAPHLSYFGRGFDDVRVALPEDRSVSAPAGGIVSNLEDMLRFLELWVPVDETAGDGLLSSRSKKRMRRFVDTGRVPDHAYGLGWTVSPFREYVRIEHGGQIFGYMANISFLPTEGLGVVTLTNKFYNNIPDIVAARAYELLLDLPHEPLHEQLLTQARSSDLAYTNEEELFWSSMDPGTPPSLPLEAMAGDYEHSTYGKMVVRALEGRFMAEFNGKCNLPLVHYSGNEFVTEHENILLHRLTFRFEDGGTGVASAVSSPLASRGTPIVFARI